MKLDLEEIGSNNLDFIGSAIDHGVNSIQEESGLIPFIFVRGKYKNELHRFQGYRTSNLIQETGTYIKNINPKPEIIVLVYEGYMGPENKKRKQYLLRYGLKTLY